MNYTIVKVTLNDLELFFHGQTFKILISETVRASAECEMTSSTSPF